MQRARDLPRLFRPGRPGDLLAAAAGVLQTLALAPLYWWPAGILAAALLFLCLREMRPLGAALRGWYYGCGLFGSGGSWVFVSIHYHGNTAMPVALLLTVLFCAGMGLLFCTLPWALSRPGFSAAPIRYACAFPLFWLFSEWSATWVLTGFPWLLAGYAHLDTPLAGWAPLGGVQLLGLLVAASGVLAVYLWRASPGARALAAGLLLLIWGGGALLRNVEWTEPGRSIGVGIVQANIPLELKWGDPQQRRHILERYESMSTPLWTEHELLVWPETSMVDWLPQSRALLQQMEERAHRQSKAFIAGVTRYTGEADAVRYYNTAIGAGAARGQYYKRHLVPFGEYVPLENWIRGLVPFFDLPLSFFESGAPEQQNLFLYGVPAPVFICYEIAYPEMVARELPDAGVLLTLSEDAWFGRSLAPYQHLGIARMRALETGRELVRATNRGLSALVDHRGRIRVRSELFKTQTLGGAVTIRSGATPFAITGIRPLLYLCLGAVLLLWASLLWRPGRGEKLPGG